MKRKQLKLKRARRAERKRTAAHRELIELLKRLDFFAAERNSTTCATCRSRTP